MKGKSRRGFLAGLAGVLSLTYPTNARAQEESRLTVALVSGSNGHTRAFDIDGLSEVWDDEHTDNLGIQIPSRSIDVSPGGSLVVVGYDNGDVRCLSASSGSEAWSVNVSSEPVMDVRFDPEDSIVWVASEGDLTALSQTDGSEVDSLVVSTDDEVTGIDFTSDGETVVFTLDDGTSAAYDLVEDEVLWEVQAGSTLQDASAIRRPAISTDDSSVFIPSSQFLGDPRRIQSLDMDDGGVEWTNDNREANTYALTADESRVWGAADVLFAGYSVSTGLEVNTGLTSLVDPHSQIALDPGEGRAVVGLTDGSLSILDISGNPSEVDVIGGIDVGDNVASAGRLGDVPGPTEVDIPDETQGIMALWDNFMVFIVLAIMGVGALGLVSKSLALAAFGAYLVFVIIAIAVDATLLTNLLIVTLVLISVGFAFKLWRLEGGGGS